jgi:hypothetical protein
VTVVTAIKLDDASYIYVAGSNQVEPLASNQTSIILKLNPDATRTLYSTTLAGTRVTKLALDPARNVFVPGFADNTFAATPGAYLTSGGHSFAAKLNSAGAVEYATYLDFIYGGIDIAVDSHGQAWVVGARCPNLVPSNCNISVNGAASAIWKLDAKGATVLMKVIFGGRGRVSTSTALFDSAFGVAVDAADSVWVVGTAESDAVLTTPGALQPKRPPAPFGLRESFGYALKLSSTGQLLYGSYIGTQVRTRTSSVVLDANGMPYFPLLFVLNNGFPDSSTIMALSADGSTVMLSAYLPALVQSIALDGKGGLYVAGNTSNMVFLTTPSVYQQFYPGGSLNGYAAKFDLTTASPSQLWSVTNAASFVEGDNLFAPEGALAPGEIVTLSRQSRKFLFPAK